MSGNVSGRVAIYQFLILECISHTLLLMHLLCDKLEKQQTSIITVINKIILSIMVHLADYNIRNSIFNYYIFKLKNAKKAIVSENSRAKKQVKIQLALWTSSFHILLAQGH